MKQEVVMECEGKWAQTSELTCILCPQGCRLASKVEQGELVEVRGNRCPRGKVYAQEEIFHPTRTLTTTVRVRGGVYSVVPAKSARPIPKEKLLEAMEEVRKLTVDAPVEVGQVLLADVAKTGVALVAGREIGSVE